MPTIISHATVPLIVGQGLRPKYISTRLIIFCALCSILPDLDVVGFKLGILYSDALGHRGASHSLTFAIVVGFIGLLLHKPLKVKPLSSFIFPFLSVLSHILFDMMTDGGLGVALFWPLDNSRFFFPFRPIRVSPFSPRALLSMKGVKVFVTEFIYVWLPCIIAALALKKYSKSGSKLH